MAELAQPADPQAQRELDAQRAAKCAAKWISELNVSEKAQRGWLDRSKKITKRYRYENSQDARERAFAMLWSNTETIKPAVYSRPPVPVVVRRFTTNDPVARAASQVLEHCLSTSIDLQDLDGVLRAARDDYVLLARGQSWERYVPTHGPEVTPKIALQIATNDAGETHYEDDDGATYEDDDVQFGEEEGEPEFYAMGEPYRPVVYEESLTDYVNWEDFGHSVARTWDEVWFVWRRAYLDRDQLVDRFGDVGKQVPLDWGPLQKGAKEAASEYTKRAAIYEIWDKRTKKVYWISKSWANGPLDERDDPLRLSGFFPCPRPLLGTTSNESVIPVADYVYYQDQAEEIDRLTARLQQLQEAIKVRGFYAASEKTNLNNVFNTSNNILIPVADWVKVKESGGVQGNIEWFPIEQVVEAAQAVIEQRAQLIQDVYQITGVADILRGMNDPSSTATAERIKGAWGTLRIRTKQKEAIRFARDVLRIKAEVIAEHFDIDTLKAMSGIELPTAEEKAQAQALYDQGAAQYQMVAQQAQASGQQPPPPPEVPEEIAKVLGSPTWEDVVGLLRDNARRQFAVDVESDSTIEPDEAEQKAQALEFLGAVGQFIQQAGAAVAAQPRIAPLMGEMIKFGARQFRAGRELEDILDRTIDDLIGNGAAGQEQQAAPDKTPVEVASINLQRERIKQQGESQRATMDAQIAEGDQAIRRNEQQLKLVVGQVDPRPQVTV